MKEDSHLAAFLRGMRKFDRLFCDSMVEGIDGTLRLEVKVNKGRLVHSRVSSDSFEKPEVTP